MSLDLVALVAVLSAALFAGAAIYITLVEHPARLSCDTVTAATQWAPSYRRATWMQAPLALVSTLAALWIWRRDNEAVWLVAGTLIFLVVPFTLIVVKPTNRQLLDPGRDLASEETRALLGRWGRLHFLRSAASLAACILMLARLVTRTG